MLPSVDETPRVAVTAATDHLLSPGVRDGAVPAEDMLMLKARQIFDLVQRRDRHFQHALMADHAMGLMLALFLAEFSPGSAEEAGLASSAAQQGREERNVTEALLDAGLIETSLDDTQTHRLALTPLGAGRMRSFISAYPDSL